MPAPASGYWRAASARPCRTLASRPRMSQYSVPPAVTGSLPNRCTSRSATPPSPTRPAITRPPDAPRSTAATTTSVIAATPSSQALSSQEGRRHPRVDRDEQPGGERQVAGAQGGHRRRHVLGQHLALEQRPLRVERAELLLGHAVDGRPLRAPAGGEDARAAHHPVRVDPVHPDADPAELGRQQPDLRSEE